MVFFICEACNESLKKNKVDAHTHTCRNCWVLSCMDCGQRFEGEAYRAHTSCISESQKYEGKFFVQKENKGDAKQQAWLSSVQRRLERAAGNTGLQYYVERLLEYDNLPRKKPKFVNFARNSLNLKADPKGIAEQLWEIVKPEEGAAAQVPAPAASAPTVSEPASAAAAPSTARDGEPKAVVQIGKVVAKARAKEVAAPVAGDAKPKASKASAVGPKEAGGGEKPRKKRKERADNESSCPPAEASVVDRRESTKGRDAAKAKQKKRKEQAAASEGNAAGDAGAGGSDSVSPKPVKWKKIIAKELRSVGGSMSFKKLRAAAISEAKAHPSHDKRKRRDLEAEFDRAIGERIGRLNKFGYDGKIVTLASGKEEA